MSHVIAEPCIGTKDTACVKACPVDCIHPYEGGSKGSFSAEKQLYIDPAECIDCAACVPACPVEAIFAEGDLPGQWQKYAAINRDWFANLGAAPAAAPAAGASAAGAPAKTPAKKAEPKPEPKPEPLVLSPEEMYKPLAVLREDVAAARGAGEAKARRSPALVALAAAVVLLFVYAVSNNFAKEMNTGVPGRLAALAMGGQKPTLAGSVYTFERQANGSRYVIRAHDSILGSRDLRLQVPAPKPFESLYHKDEVHFASATNQSSRFYYEFIDRGSDGTLDSVLAVREIWSDGQRYLGRYQSPTAPTPELQALYLKSAEEAAQKLGAKN